MGSGSGQYLRFTAAAGASLETAMKIKVAKTKAENLIIIIIQNKLWTQSNKGLVNSRISLLIILIFLSLSITILFNSTGDKNY